jgi:hypothetical protein
MDGCPSDETLLLAVAERDMVMLGAPGLPRGAAWWAWSRGRARCWPQAWFRDAFAYVPFALYWASVLAMSILLLAGR